MVLRRSVRPYEFIMFIMPASERTNIPDFAPVVALLRRTVPGLQAVYLFGSAAESTLRAESDVDLAVLAAAPMEAVARWEVQEDVASLLGRDVDLVDLRTANTVLQAQVVEKGRVLAEPDRTARQFFEVFVCSSYALLNEERRGIIDDALQRGSIYGR